MGFLKAFGGALSGSFANQWLEYMAPPANMTDHVLLARARAVKVNGSENNDGEENAMVISNGSKFMVPEGTCLIIVKNGGIEGVIAEPGGYVYTTDNTPEARSMFAGDGFFASTFGQSFEQFKYGGQPGNQQVAFYVNLKNIAGLTYGTQNPIRYKDGFYGNMMLAVTSNGTYTIKVVDPILMYKNLVPVDIATGQSDRTTFELGKEDGGVEESLFSAFVGSLGAALSAFTKGGKSIDDIQGGIGDFAVSVNEVIEEKYKWKSQYGIEVVAVEPRGLDWDAPSTEMINKFNLGNLMQGSVGAGYMQAQVADGMKAAGENGGNMAAMGMGYGMINMNGMAPNMGAAGQMVNPIAQQQMMQAQQMAQPAQAAPAPEAPAAPEAQAPAEGETPAEGEQNA